MVDGERQQDRSHQEKHALLALRWLPVYIPDDVEFESVGRREKIMLHYIIKRKSLNKPNPIIKIKQPGRRARPHCAISASNMRSAVFCFADLSISDSIASTAVYIVNGQSSRLRRSPWGQKSRSITWWKGRKI